ncbi:MAG: carboxypeptidase-like regulatory domain-containing protein [Acidobacteria bacterium]|nr:carboxypeptidase-like regulatory domain-containing protein [Acidobacteriota bacterium]
MRRTYGLVVAVALAAAWVGITEDHSVAAQADDGMITGVVTSADGAEAGVWVIAETDDLETVFRKIVVTDDDGKFLMPEMPDAGYDVWVRGYGLLDSTPVTARPGADLSLAATVAPTPQEAAQVYPANYWLALIDLPGAHEFPGTGDAGNGINERLQDQGEWINVLKGCQRCHQVGNERTRVVPDLDQFDSTVAAWEDRTRRGQRGSLMSSFITQFGRARGLDMVADWSDRIAAGALPPVPPRPSGIERNVVLTMWNWGDNVAFVHDEIATDKRNPRVNANGPIYGVDIGNDFLLITDTEQHQSTMLKIPLRAEASTVPSMFATEGFEPWRDFGEEAIWNDPANPHNPMLDGEGRVWLTTRVQSIENPDWCKDGSDNAYAKNFPVNLAFRHAGYFDPDAQKFVLIHTCFGTHHLQFAEDDNNTLYFSGGGDVVGWLNTKMYDETGDERASQGWCPTVLDTNGDGVISKPWNEPARRGEEAAFDPALDTRIAADAYGVITNPLDDAVWVVSDDYPGRLVRLDPGDNPPETCVSELYTVPAEHGYRTRGLDVDRNGILWAALAGSSHFASFDRSKCTVFNGPTVRDGRQCDEGWEFFKAPGPDFKGTNIGTDFHYYNWVDQFNTLGLGENVPIANGSSSDSLLALMPDTKEWVVMRVPYPQGFHSRGIDGRIDDPNGGWKGRGIYATYGADAAWHVEGGPVEPGNLVKFQIRPHPLAN